LKWCFLCLWVTFVDIFRCFPYEMGVRIGGVQMGNIHKEDGGNTETQGHRGERLERQDSFSSFIHSNICTIPNYSFRRRFPYQKAPSQLCLQQHCLPPFLLAPYNARVILPRFIIQKLLLLDHILNTISKSMGFIILNNLIPL